MKNKRRDYSILGLSMGMILGVIVIILLDYQGIKSPIKNDTATLFVSMFVFSILGLIIGLSLSKGERTND